MLARATEREELTLAPRETKWLSRLAGAADALPDTEEELLAAVADRVELGKVRLEDYDLAVGRSS